MSQPPPLRRSTGSRAARRRLVERLVKDCGASVNSKERPEVLKTWVTRVYIGYTWVGCAMMYDVAWIFECF